jgi:hypothetical protein
MQVVNTADSLIINGRDQISDTHTGAACGTLRLDSQDLYGVVAGKPIEPDQSTVSTTDMTAREYASRSFRSAADCDLSPLSPLMSSSKPVPFINCNVR